MALRWLAAVSLVFLGLGQPALSQTAGSQPEAPQAATDEASREQELNAAFADGAKAATKGKADVPLLAQASLHLPAGYMFIPQPQAARILRAQGNTAGPSLAGLIFPASGRLDWFVAVKFIDSGYIKDDEAKEWNADELLKNLREGTEEANKDRIARGFEPIEVVGWAELPAVRFEHSQAGLGCDKPREERRGWLARRELQHIRAGARRLFQPQSADGRGQAS